MEYEFIKHVAGTGLKTFVVRINSRELHFHSDMELLMVLEGSVSIDDGQKRHLLQRDDLFLSNRNAVHSLRRTQDDNLLMVVQFDQGLCKAYYPEISRVRFSHRHITRAGDPEYWATLRGCMKEIVACYSEKKTGYPVEMMSILNHMLFCMLQYDDAVILDEKTVKAENRDMESMRRIIETMRDNYKYPITLKEIAQKENLDMYYLSHFIKSCLGISFQSYLNRMRAERAEYLLLHTDLSHIDICMECGFSDYKYLNKTFVREFGCTPAEYRKKYRTSAARVDEHNDQHIIMEAGRALRFLREDGGDTQSCP